jgi:hypothetical protein
MLTFTDLLPNLLIKGEVIQKCPLLIVFET